MPRQSFKRDPEYDPEDPSNGSGMLNAIDVPFCVGKEDALDRVVGFCQKVAESPEFETDVTFLLTQLGRGSTAPIARWVFSPGETPEVLAALIVDAAVDDGGNVGRGKCSYCVSLEGVKGRTSFSLEFPKPDDDDEGAPELATEEGALALLMRIVHTQQKTITHLQDGFIKFVKADNAELRQENRELRKTQVEGIKTLAELYDARLLRDIKLKQEIASEERKDEIVGLVANVGIPLIMSKLMGANIPGAKTALEAQVEGFVRSIRPEQLNQIAAVLAGDQTQMAAFQQIMTTVVEREAAGRRAAAAAGAAQAADAANSNAAPPQQGAA